MLPSTLEMKSSIQFKIRQSKTWMLSWFLTMSSLTQDWVSKRILDITRYVRRLETFHFLSCFSSHPLIKNTLPLFWYCERLKRIEDDHWWPWPQNYLETSQRGAFTNNDRALCMYACCEKADTAPINIQDLSSVSFSCCPLCVCRSLNQPIVDMCFHVW